MKFQDKRLEIIVRLNDNGDFTVESNTRENLRVWRALFYVVSRLKRLLNQSKKPELLLPQDHRSDVFELTRN